MSTGQAAAIAALANLTPEQLTLAIATALTAPAAPATPCIKISPPQKKFKYERLYNIYTFIFACEAVFDHQGTTDKWTHVCYTISYLEGTPIMWAQSFIQKLSATVWATYTWAQFKTDLTGIYGNPDHHLGVAGDLLRLQQKHSAAEYTSEFSALSQLTNWDNQALTDQFYDGLKQEVCVEIARGTFPASLTNLVHEAIQINSRLFEGRRGSGSYRPVFSQNRPPPQTRHDPNAMDVDATTRLPRLKPELRSQLMREGKCFRCRKGGHISRECKGGPAVVAATSTAPAVEPNYCFDPNMGEENSNYVAPDL